jgi:hypothetical protein
VLRDGVGNIKKALYFLSQATECERSLTFIFYSSMNRSVTFAESCRGRAHSVFAGPLKGFLRICIEVAVRLFPMGMKAIPERVRMIKMVPIVYTVTFPWSGRLYEPLSTGEFLKRERSWHNQRTLGSIFWCVPICSNSTYILTRLIDHPGIVPRQLDVRLQLQRPHEYSRTAELLCLL